MLPANLAADPTVEGLQELMHTTGPDLSALRGIICNMESLTAKLLHHGVRLICMVEGV
jgi:hypothetical protein